MSTSEPGGELDIAVIGLAGRFAAAASVGEFWDAVRAGSGLTSEFSVADMTAAGVPPTEQDRADHVRVGGVLPGADLFDSRFFGYSPRDAALLDPQQRLFLECAWLAMEDAGYTTASFRGLVGTYASAGASTYLISEVAANPRLLNEASLHELLLANDKDTLATRVAYHLDLGGPALTVQSACSSSLVAIHLACQALIGRECDLALAGGVSVHFPQREGYRYQQGGVLSPDGRCRPFDARANGTVNGDGVGVVVLKRLADAIEDRDAIAAVVKGSAVTNDGGRRVGFTAPGTDGQRAAITAAHQVAGVSPRSISYVEAHGTGTALGDPIEFAALCEAFAVDPPPPGACALGSVKAVTGHLDAAAGITGFIKCVLAVRDGVIPPSPYLDRPNDAVALVGSPFRIPVLAEPWPGLARPRRAAVSSFGMGGTNCHLVLEQGPTPFPARPARRAPQILAVSGATPQAARAAAGQLAGFLAAHPGRSLADVAFTTQAGRRPLRHRHAVVADSVTDAVKKLKGLAATGAAVDYGERHDRPVVFMLPGQGVQYPGMCRELYETEPAFRDQFDLCADLSAGYLDTDLREIVYGPVRAGAAHLVDRPEYTQAALFAVEYSMASMWLEWGVRPWALIGHSLGEYVAACLAGVFRLEDAVRLVCVRGQLMQGLPEGRMHTVSLGAPELARLLPSGTSSVAAENAPGLSVASGPPEAMARLAAVLDERGIKHRELRTARAFHSAAMEPVMARFEAEVRSARPRPPRLRLVSNVTGGLLTADLAEDPGYWARHLRSPVRFAQGIALLLAGGGQVFLEVGPGSALSALAQRQSGTGPENAVIASCPARPAGSNGASGEAGADHHVAQALAQLFAAGATVDWDGYWKHDRRGRVSLPGYPFERRGHRLRASRTPEPPAPAGPPGLEPGPEVESAPGTTATRVHQAWADLLGLEAIAPEDDFFQLGGHSLLASRVVARLHDELAVEIPVATVFDAPTLAAFTAAIEEFRTAPSPGNDPPDALLAELEQLPEEELRLLLSEIPADFPEGV